MDILVKKYFNGEINMDFMLQHVRSKFHKTVNNYPLFLMLCGGDRNLYQNRKLIEKYINKSRVDVFPIYSEDSFKVQDNIDLLRFEEILAELSTLIIIILESFGSATELGAFSYNDAMISRLYIIYDEYYKNHNSFINDGPIKKIIKTDINRLSYTKFLEIPGKQKKELQLTSKITTSINNLLNHSEENFSMESIYKIDNNKVMTIYDLKYFAYMLIDITYIFVYVEPNDYISLIKTIFNVNRLNFDFKSGNKKINEDSIASSVLSLLHVWKIIKKSSKYYILSPEVNNLLKEDKLTFGQIILNKSFYSNIKFSNFKSWRINTAYKKGII